MFDVFCIRIYQQCEWWRLTYKYFDVFTCWYTAEFVLDTTKISAVIGKVATLINYAKSDLIDWHLAFIRLPAAATGGVLGAKAILYF
jgi:uncharacterized membrane protein YfcA